MTLALQIVLLIAALAFIALSACLIPVAILAHRRLERLSLAAEELKREMSDWLRDSREMVKSVDALTKQAQLQLDDVGQVTEIVRQWAVRADRLVDAAGSVIEPPVLSLARTANLVRTGMGTFLGALFQSWRNGRHEKQETPSTKESEYV